MRILVWGAAAAGLVLAAGGAAGFAGWPPSAPVPPAGQAPVVPVAIGARAGQFDSTVIQRRAATEAWIEHVRAAPASEREVHLDRGIAAMEAHLSRTPTDAFAWYALAAFRISRSGYAEPVLAALRMSYYTGRNELFLMMQRVDLSLALYGLLPPEMTREVDLEIDGLAQPFRGPEMLQQLARSAVRAGPLRVEMVAERVRRQSDFSATQFDAFVAEERRSTGRPVR